MDKPDKNPCFSTKWCLFVDKAITNPESIMLNELQQRFFAGAQNDSQCEHAVADGVWYTMS